jgi:hypothetical protein
LLLRFLGRNEEFQAALDRLIATSGPSGLFATLRAAVLADDPPQGLVELVPTILSQAQAYPTDYATLQICGATLLRTGDAENAVVHLQNAIESTQPAAAFPQEIYEQQKAVWESISPGGIGGQTYDWLLISLANLQLGRLQEAQGWRATANESFKFSPIEKVEDYSEPDAPGRETAFLIQQWMLKSHTWNRRMEVSILRDELERAMRKGSAD